MQPSSSTSSSEQFWKFTRRALGLLAILFLFDRALGAMAEHWYFKTQDGDTGGQINGLLAQRNSVVVFGDSRAEAHYDPGVLGSSLGTSVFNAGFKGSNALYFYGLEQLLFERYTPRVIVLDFSEYGIVRSRDDPYQKLYPLYPYWRERPVWQLITGDGWIARLAFASRLYPYNSKIHSIVIFNVLGHRPHAVRGFDPQFGQMDVAPLEPLDRSPAVYSDKLVVALDKFIVSAHDHGVAVVIVESPRYAQGSFVVPPAIEQRIRQYALPVIDFSVASHPQFANPRLYYDLGHLNYDGAELFSRELGAELCTLYCGSRLRNGP